MQIAVASGKGGTGKTTVATNLALTMTRMGEKVTYADCDVEEPNGHLFLKPSIETQENVGVLVPQVDYAKCNGCGKCGEICHFSAIVVLGGKPLTFPELCHSCGGCSLVCEPKAIKEVSRDIGQLSVGKVGDLAYIAGRLRIGEAMPSPLIRRVKRTLPKAGHAVIDAPPGTSCPVVETIKGTDFVLLVTEPTPFGLNDLKLAVETVRKLEMPVAVLLNRAGVGDDRVQCYCDEEGIELIAEIPDDRRIAEAYSRGEMVIKALPEYESIFIKLFNNIRKRITSKDQTNIMEGVKK